MAISQKEVEHIALLSRLALGPEEMERYTQHLQDILSYAEQIDELSTDDIEPMSHSIRITNVMRDSDQIGPMLDAKSALKNAPDQSEPFYRVPKVTEPS